MADTLREEFEAWTTGPEGAWIDGAVWRDSNGNYGEVEIAREWEIWQAANRAALASRPAEVDDEGLPPLPDHIEVGGEGWDIEDFKSEKTFTVDHLWQYARYAVVADQAQRGDGWISVDDRMPGKERCLAAYVNAAGKHRIIRAMYVDQFQIDAGEDAIDQGNCEYNEADDTFYLKAGWLECIDNWDDYSSIYVTEGTVTHWRRLPAAPSHTTNKEK